MLVKPYLVDIESPTTMGSRISGLRQKLGLTQREFAQALGILDTSQISKYETGRKRPSLKVLIKMCHLADVSLDWIVLGKGSGAEQGR